MVLVVYHDRGGFERGSVRQILCSTEMCGGCHFISFINMTTRYIEPSESLHTSIHSTHYYYYYHYHQHHISENYGSEWGARIEACYT